MPANIRSAEAVGIQGFLFTGDVPALRRQVASLGTVFPR